MKTTEILEMLNGCEVMSWEHEGTVLVKGEFGFVNGEKFKITDEDALHPHVEFSHGHEIAPYLQNHAHHGYQNITN